jgi:L-asparaginase
MKKRILIIGTGGTIACVQTEAGLSPAVTSQELLTYIPEMEQLCQMDYTQLFTLDSTNIQPEHWLLIARTIQEQYHRYDGFVVTHGTDTMAYTAAALSYLIQNGTKPIVLTGAQKPISALITDAKKNLIDSVRFACEPGCAGCYVVFDGKVILGTRARKVRTKSYAAFNSINYPLAAFIDESRILRYGDTLPPQAEPTFYTELAPRAFLLKLFPGLHPDVLHYIGEHYDAIVMESYGVGGVPFGGSRDFLTAVEDLAKKGKIVVLASQVMLEGSDAEKYEVGFYAIHEYGVFQVYDMTVEAALVKLMWILAQTHDPAQVRAMFFTPVHHDIITGAV